MGGYFLTSPSLSHSVHHLRAKLLLRLGTSPIITSIYSLQQLFSIATMSSRESLMSLKQCINMGIVRPTFQVRPCILA